MIISKENKYIYMAVPKTGTTSVQKLLLAKDKSSTKNRVEIREKVFYFREHMIAADIKETLGKHSKDYKIIGFIRHPYGKIVSSYFFYKNGAKAWSWEGREKQKPISEHFKIKLANILPFHFWALLYPYKSNLEYFIDKKNNLIVDKQDIGLFENLEEDLKKIFKKYEILSNDEIPHENKSFHENEGKYFQSKIFRFLINFKIKKDLNFYNMIASEKSA